MDLLPDDLQDASKQSENVVLELALGGTIRYLSSSWQDITGYPASDLINTNISLIIIGDANDREVFVKAAEAMTSDESSYRVRFLTSHRPPEAAQLFMRMDSSKRDSVSIDGITNNDENNENQTDPNTQLSYASLHRKYSNYFKTKLKPSQKLLQLHYLQPFNF